MEELINHQNANGETLLILAGKQGNTRLIKALIESGADMSILDNEHNDYLFYLTKYLSSEKPRYVLEHTQ